MNKQSWIHRDGCDKRVQVMPAVFDEAPEPKGQAGQYYISPPPPVAEPYTVSEPVGRWPVRPIRPYLGPRWP